MTFGSTMQQPPTPPFWQSSPRANLGTGIVGALAAGVIGAFVWGGVGAVTNHNFSLVAIGVGVLVAVAATKAAGGRAPELGIAAAVITIVSCFVGDIGAAYFAAAHELGVSVGDLMNVVSPVRVLSDEVKHEHLTMIFIAVGAFYAFRHAATGNGRRGAAPVPAGAPVPNAGAPNFRQPAHPNFASGGQPMPPASADAPGANPGIPLA